MPLPHSMHDVSFSILCFFCVPRPTILWVAFSQISPNSNGTRCHDPRHQRKWRQVRSLLLLERQRRVVFFSFWKVCCSWRVWHSEGSWWWYNCLLDRVPTQTRCEIEPTKWLRRTFRALLLLHLYFLLNWTDLGLSDEWKSVEYDIEK